MNVAPTLLPGVLVVEPDVYGDERGYFLETFHLARYTEAAGIERAFVQDNHSRSGRGVLRGLHLQKRRPQGKLVQVSRGRIFDVAVDVNPTSGTYGKWVGVELSDENHRQLWIPPGYAHGFCVLSDIADVHYKCTAYHDATDEAGLRWDSPEIGIEWPVAKPVVSARDRALPSLAELTRKLTAEGLFA
jgi:dTDP-4-dehydrorhamnose 3,5-epimerase